MDKLVIKYIVKRKAPTNGVEEIIEIAGDNYKFISSSPIECNNKIERNNKKVKRNVVFQDLNEQQITDKQLKAIDQLKGIEALSAEGPGYYHSMRCHGKLR